MQAYEFYTTAENGFIRIPDEYKNKINNQIKVIIMDEKPWKFDREEANARKKSDILLPPALKTKGWRYIQKEFDERG